MISKQARIWTGYGAALLATIIWAGNFVAARALADKIPPCELNFWRWLVALIAILPFALPHIKKDLQILRNNFAYFSLMGFIGVTLLNVFIYTAGQTTPSLNMALIMPTTPIVIIILARIIYHLPITFSRLTGMLIALSGIIFLVSKGKWEKLIKLDFTSGDIWTICGMLCFAVFSLFTKKRPANITSIGFNTIIFALGLVYCLPLVFMEKALIQSPPFTWEAFWGILYSGIGCSTIGFWLWTVGIDRIGPVAAGIVYYSLPVYAALMGWIILDEKIVSAQITGGIMIIAGIVCASLPKRHNEITQSRK